MESYLEWAKTVIVPVALAVIALLGSLLAHRSQDRKRQQALADASDPSALAIITGGAFAERKTAEANTEALNRIADGLTQLAKAGGDPGTAEVRRSRQLELLEEARKLRHCAEEGVRILAEIVQRDRGS